MSTFAVLYISGREVSGSLLRVGTREACEAQSVAHEEYVATLWQEEGRVLEFLPAMWPTNGIRAWEARGFRGKFILTEWE